MTALLGSSPKKRDPLVVLEGGRLCIRKRSPFLLSSTYALTPVPYPKIPTSFITPGLVFAYNPDFIGSCTDEEAGFVMLHEVFHDRLRFFHFIKVLGEQYVQVANDAQDMVINVMLREMGWPVFSWALLPGKFGFPEKLSTQEYIDLLLKNDQKSKEGGGGDKKGADGKEKHQCHAPSHEEEKNLDAQYGRSEAEVRAVERRTAKDIESHKKKMGRGTVPGWMEEWAKIVLEEPVRIDWRQRLSHLTLHLGGQIIAGGDDFSIRRPSKRSHVRRIIRPGLVEQELVVAFVIDTSGSMNEQMMLAGVRYSASVLQQLGLEEAWYLEADTQVAAEPKLINLSYFQDSIKFHGRGGTDFRPAFAAIQKLSPRPDLVFYWTDGDGSAPKMAPPGIETIWGLVPGRYSTRKPAKWGHLVVIDDDPTKQDTFEYADPYEDDEEEEDDP